PTYAFDKKVCWINPVKEVHHETNGFHIPDISIQQQTQENTVPEKSIIKNTVMRKTELIKRVKGILENASGIETDGVNPDSSFIEIGLDSLLLTQVALTLKKEFKLPITFRKLTEEYGSLSLLAEYLDANLPQETKQESITINTQNNHHSSVNSISALNNNSNHTSGNGAIDLISQQIQLLAQQIALMQNNNQSQSPIPAAVNENHTVHAPESDITPEEI